MSDSLSAAIALSGLFGACWVVPWFGMRALVPTIRDGRLHTSNYRGRSVTPGLGIVWVWWSGGLLLILAADALLSFWDGFAPLMVVSLIAVVASFVFGIIDDVFDAGAAKGFGGHLGALRSGRMTTGMLKLLGIGLISLLLGGGIAFYGGETPFAPAALLRGSVIALGANTINLLDLRPGRALKAYVGGGVAILVATPLVTLDSAGGVEMWPLGLLVPILGPAVAVWRYDLAEEGMLGDAGANPAGALLGVLVAALWPLWAVAVAAGLALALNIASERWSFSVLIDKSGVLRRIDDLGRRR